MSTPLLLPCIRASWRFLRAVGFTEAREALAQALKLLRLAEALCCERRKLRSFWPLPDDSSSHAPVDANEAKENRNPKPAM